MQASRSPWKTAFIRSGRPTVGNLMGLCEENYRALMRLVPELHELRGEVCSVVDRDQDLFLEILEQAPYTTLLRLTYYFPHHDGKVHRTVDPDPDTLLRAYHDAGQVEVLDLRRTTLPIHTHYLASALETKWKVNLFLSKWLAFCLARGYRVFHRTGGTRRSGGQGIGSDPVLGRCRRAKPRSPAPGEGAPAPSTARGPGGRANEKPRSVNHKRRRWRLTRATSL